MAIERGVPATSAMLELKARSMGAMKRVEGPGQEGLISGQGF